MQIEAPCVVGLTWTLSDGQDRPIDELTEPVDFIVGGDDLLPAIEAALLGQSVGFEGQIDLEPEQAFGDYDAALVCFEDRALFPTHLEQGMQFEGLPEGAVTPGMPTDAIYTVTELYPSHVVLDGNHPLAGMMLRIRLKVCSVRPASEEEVRERTAAPSELSVSDAPLAPPRVH